MTTWSAGAADAHMDEQILVKAGDSVRQHPWWRARADLTLALLRRCGVRPPASVLDAGCGWGVTLDRLEASGYRAAGLDVSPRILAELDRPGRTLIEADLTCPLPESSGTFDAVLALDVIEHVDDDRGVVARLGELARPGGGLVVVSVPARPDLFSEFDAVQGHRRRYLPERLAEAFGDTGLEIDRIFWWGSWLLPLLPMNRVRKVPEPGEPAAESYKRHLRLPPWPAPLLFRTLFALEQPRALDGRLKSGTSLFAVARKP